MTGPDHLGDLLNQIANAEPIDPDYQADDGATAWNDMVHGAKPFALAAANSIQAAQSAGAASVSLLQHAKTGGTMRIMDDAIDDLVDALHRAIAIDADALVRSRQRARNVAMIDAELDRLGNLNDAIEAWLDGKAGAA